MKPTPDGKTRPSAETDTDRPIVSHLAELRQRLLRIFIGVGAVFLALFPFANPIYNHLSAPLVQYLPQGSSMVAIEVASPFLTPFKMTMLLALVISLPLVFHQLWGFVAPGLYRNEKRVAFPLLVSSTLLFYAGMAFAYFVVFPLMFAFFTGIAPQGVTVMTDIGRYLDFVVKIFIAFGIAFEVPVITLVLVKAGTTTVANLSRKRPYIIVGAFVVGMMLTPPDVISQVLLAVPIWLLFELGLLLARLLERGAEKPAGGAPPLNEGKP